MKKGRIAVGLFVVVDAVVLIDGVKYNNGSSIITIRKKCKNVL